VCSRIRTLLGQRGALFQSEIARHLGGFGPELEDALWDMIWAGELTNDTLAPLRSLAPHKPTTSRPRPRSLGLPARYTFSPRGASGRYALRRARWEAEPSVTEKRTATAHALLLRYGVVVREAASAESLAGGFSTIYDVLKAMEESGRLHRGYFVEGRGATQFALPEAADRLRANRTPPVDPDTRWLAATDPANPYGALVPWPEVEGGGPQRTPGAHVVLVDGALVGYLGRGHDALLTFLPEDEPQRTRFATGLAHALAARVVRGDRRALLLERIDHHPAAQSPLGPFLADAGFSLGARGWMKRMERLLPTGADDDG
jgi:ATP-dependent Lhr-like helicase